MNRIPATKRIASIFLLCCMFASMLPETAYGAPSARDSEVVKQGTLVTSEDGMVTVHETVAHTSGNNFDVTMTVTTSDLVEIEPVRPAHIVLCIDRSNSMDGERRTNTKAAVSQFVDGVLDEDGIAAGNQIAVVGFGTRYWTHSGLTSDVSRIKSAVTAATTAVSNVNDGGTATDLSNVPGYVVSEDTVCKALTYQDEEYTYTGSTPSALTLTAGVDNTLTLRYDRTVETSPAPVMTKYTVIHQYYSGRNLDGQTQEFFEGDIGDIIAAAGITKNTEFSNGVYSFTSASYAVIVLSENGENKIILQYNREETSAEPDPGNTPSMPTDPTPYNVLQFSPTTGDNSDTWLYIFAGAALALFLLFVVPIIPSRPEEGGRYRGSRRKK